MHAVPTPADAQTTQPSTQPSTHARHAFNVRMQARYDPAVTALAEQAAYARVEAARTELLRAERAFDQAKWEASCSLASSIMQTLPRHAHAHAHAHAHTYTSSDVRGIGDARGGRHAPHEHAPHEGTSEARW